MIPSHWPDELSVNRGSIPGRVILKTLKMILNATLFNTQHYNVRIKGKLERSREWSSALSYTLEREPSGCPRLQSPTLLLLVMMPNLIQCIYLLNASERVGCDTRSIFKRRWTGLNSKFSFFSTGCHTKVKESNLRYYLPKAEGRIAGFMPSQNVLLLYEFTVFLLVDQLLYHS